MNSLILKISDKEYNELDALRATALKELVKSPFHCRYCEHEDKKPTPALIFGRQLHSYILEPEKFTAEHLLLEEKLYKSVFLFVLKFLPKLMCLLPYLQIYQLTHHIHL